MSDQARLIEVPTDLPDEPDADATAEDYRFILMKHQTYRQEMLVTTIIKAIGELVLFCAVCVLAISLGNKGGPVAIIGFGLSVIGALIRLFISLANYSHALNTLYDSQIEGKDVPEQEGDHYERIIIYLIIIPLIAGIIGVAFNL